MGGCVLRILNDEEENIIKNLLLEYSSISYIYKMPILYGPKNKFNNLENFDYETLFCINNISKNGLDGVTYENFVNKKYNTIGFSFNVYVGSIIGKKTNYISYKICNYMNDYIHNAIITKLQNTYILLKQLFNVTDINQYILKMYANVIL